jgi:peptidoglycan/LPS O-acetylase OafA/YrhL
MKIGFGTWRFFLAFLVVISHLWAGMLDGPAAYAVWGFFVLSGYLMTYVLAEKYGPSKAGLQDFAYNRILRIFPAYAVAAVCGWLVLRGMPHFGANPASLNGQFVMPTSLLDWVKNITLLPLTDGGPLLVPVSGALAVEVGVYVLMPLLAFGRGAAWLGLILSLLLNWKHGIQIESFGVRYSTFLTCIAPFALGSLVAHYRIQLAFLKTPASVVVWLLHGLLWLFDPHWPWMYGLYVSALLSAWVVLSLADCRTARLDAWLGDLSYPLYLFHTTVAVLLLPLMGSDRSFGFFAAAFLLTMIVCYLVLVCVDRPLQQLKKRRDLRTATGAAAPVLKPAPCRDGI